MVAATLVVAMLSVAAPMVVRTARIWKQTQHVQLAMDELSTQMDRLIAMPAEIREVAIEEIAVSPEVSGVLNSAKLMASRVNDDDGDRIELAINWQRVGNPPPVRLTAWIGSVPESGNDEEPTE